MQVAAGGWDNHANLAQGRTNETLYKITAGRWKSLVEKGAVSKQENDTYQAQYDAQRSSVQALEKAVLVAKSSASPRAARTRHRFQHCRSDRAVLAPFSFATCCLSPTI